MKIERDVMKVLMFCRWGPFLNKTGTEIMRKENVRGFTYFSILYFLKISFLFSA